MRYSPQHFDLWELVCPHAYYMRGEMCWQFRDEHQMVNLDWVRNKLGPVFVNNWHEPEWINSDYIRAIRELVAAGEPIIPSNLPDHPDGLYSERGLRCNVCNTVIKKTNAGIIYLSAHPLGKADDYTVQGRPSEEVRQYLIQNKKIVPFPFRLEKGTSWVHQDSEDSGINAELVNP
jgi:hypothetical protein